MDLGIKYPGYIPLSELSDDPTVKPEDLVKVGDEIETYVMPVSDRDCVVKLSKKRLDVVKGWEEIEAAQENETVMEGVVTEDNKGGVVVSVKGVRVFVPASQTGLPRETPMTELLKQKVRLVITEVNRARRRVVGSISQGAARRAGRRRREGLGRDRGRQALHRHGEVPDFLRRLSWTSAAWTAWSTSPSCLGAASSTPPRWSRWATPWTCMSSPPTRRRRRSPWA